VFDEVTKIDSGKVVPASVQGLQNGLLEILRNPAQLKLYKVNIKKYVYKHFTWDSVISKYLKLYPPDIGWKKLT